MTKNDLARLKSELSILDAQPMLLRIAELFGEKAILSSSLAIESQVLTHMWCKSTSRPRVFILDTGRMHEETYETMNASIKFFGLKYEVMFPEAAATAAMMREHGPNLFFDSVENRKLCCHVRKVEPMKKILKTAEAWITGLRRDQAVTRSTLEKVEWDDGNGLFKFNPIADWTLEQIWKYAREHKLPYNSLHDRGFPSIGCAPCTRAVKPGEDERAGRWWWEVPEQRECGIHLKDGKLVRTSKG